MVSVSIALLYCRQSPHLLLQYSLNKHLSLTHGFIGKVAFQFPDVGSGTCMGDIVAGNGTVNVVAPEKLPVALYRHSAVLVSIYQTSGPPPLPTISLPARQWLAVHLHTASTDSIRYPPPEIKHLRHYLRAANVCIM